MPELRRNPLNGTWVVVAAERAARPDTFRRDDPPVALGPTGDCPFCPGNEHLTPPEVDRRGEGAAGSPGWRVRVVPNLYPIVDGPPVDYSDRRARFHDALRGGGAHEVAVLSPDHSRSLADLSGAEVEELFEVVAARARIHLDAGHDYVQVLVNHGRTAGASIEHPHAQIVAVDVPPPAVRAEVDRVEAAPECLVCRAAGEDADRSAPLSVYTGDVAVWCPWWSGIPFELMVAPREHAPRFEEAEVGAVARGLGHALALLRHALGDVPYNVVVHTAPKSEHREYHWHVHVWPRISVQAGFEQGSGILVNQIPPEHAAAALRAEVGTPA